MKRLLILVAVVATPANATTMEDRVCAALGVIANSAALSRERGVPLESAQAIFAMRARDLNVPASRQSRMLAAVAHGYRARNPDTAEQTAVQACKEGSL